MRIGIWALVGTSIAALLALAIRLKPATPAHPPPPLTQTSGSPEQASTGAPADEAPTARQARGSRVQLLQRVAESYGDPADSGTLEFESDLRAQWQAAAQASQTRRKAKLDSEFASQAFDGQLTQSFRTRLVGALKAAQRDPALLSELECRETLCRVELNVPRGTLSSLSATAGFRVESFELRSDGDAGLCVLAYVNPTPPEPVKPGAAARTPDVASPGRETASSQER